MVIFTGIAAVSTLGPAADPAKNNRTAPQPPPSLVVKRSHHNRHRLLIIKFGGSSLSDAKRISHAVETVAREYGRGKRVAVVVSAVGKTTDQLLE
ncbi:MAG TPA: hypothetical protein VFV92_12340, partial [Candidatus Bathyarchaeia archaeon]|nr:hypothetical protein [Candidatus Bathyarchaeia archaeon]